MQEVYSVNEGIIGLLSNISNFIKRCRLSHLRWTDYVLLIATILTFYPWGHRSPYWVIIARKLSVVLVAIGMFIEINKLKNTHKNGGSIDKK